MKRPMWATAVGIFGIIVDIVLIIVVATVNKEAFLTKGPPVLHENI